MLLIDAISIGVPGGSREIVVRFRPWLPGPDSGSLGVFSSEVSGNQPAQGASHRIWAVGRHIRRAKGRGPSAGTDLTGRDTGFAIVDQDAGEFAAALDAMAFRYTCMPHR